MSSASTSQGRIPDSNRGSKPACGPPNKAMSLPEAVCKPMQLPHVCPDMDESVSQAITMPAEDLHKKMVVTTKKVRKEKASSMQNDQDRNTALLWRHKRGHVNVTKVAEHRPGQSLGEF